jgi:hypothetical protein
VARQRSQTTRNLSKTMIDCERFPSSQKFSAPHKIDEILELLSPQVTLNVPDHILSLWFPPGPAQDLIELFNLFRLLHVAFLDTCLRENPHGHHEDCRDQCTSKNSDVGHPLQ